MKKLLTLVMVLSALFIAAPVGADPGTLYVDDDGLCGGNSPCYAHPQDAVNAANPGDTIKVYPGTYGHRQFTSPVPPHWGPGDQYAPALIVWKDGLTIEAVDPDPSKTVIQTTYNFWVNRALPGGGGGGSIEHSTGCTWNSVAKTWDGTCVRPAFGTAPNAVAIIASNVTIRGFTLHRPYDFTDGTYNTAGVMIGGLYAGYGGAGETLGLNNNTVENCVFSDVWHAVYIWHSSGNRIVNNTVAALNTDHWAAISTYDGYNDAQIGYGNLSENNLIVHNAIANKGIALGAWAPPTWTSNAGSQVCHNATTWVGVTYAHGPVVVGCNTGNFWHTNTDQVIRITGVTYTGDTELWSVSNADVNLSAQLNYEGSADGSGVEFVFTVNSTEYHATTVAGGTASTTANLPPGVYTVETKVTVCDDCEFKDTDTLRILVPPTADANGPYEGNEGTPIPLDGTDSSDPDGMIISYEWDLDADGEYDDATGPTPSWTWGDDYASNIGLKVTDNDGGTATDTTTVTISNVPPSVTILSPADGALYQVGTLVSVSASYTDPGNDTHTCSINWDDSSTSACTDSHLYSAAGVYTVRVTVADDDGGTGTASVMVVVYDPAGGFVTGGGWINSPAGAYSADPTLTGKATFGFVSKYNKGANIPEGNTEFQFKAGNLNFHSSSYDWLVVNQGGTNAQFKGMGTINGEGSYKFMLWAGDDPDTFRIKIWEEVDGVETVVYDNGVEQAIGGGSIVVHKAK